MGFHALKTLLVDDEPVARQVLREELEAWPDVDVIGEAENGKQALEQIAELRPDLVFLDLQMPAMGGFEVVRNLRGQWIPVIVIVTAFDEHAIEAFEAGAVDYLLKPVSQPRLRSAVDRAHALKNRPLEIANEAAKIAAAEVQPDPATQRTVVGRLGTDYFILKSEEVLAFQAERELVWIVTAKQRLLATRTLKMLTDQLNEQQFLRVHRNAIVNVDHVRKMTSLSSQRWLVTLSNGLQLVASKRQAHNIRKILHW
jgi:DNA-binding LytR/AlgR family response regulator